MFKVPYETKGMRLKNPGRQINDLLQSFETASTYESKAASNRQNFVTAGRGNDRPYADPDRRFVGEFPRAGRPWSGAEAFGPAYPSRADAGRESTLSSGVPRLRGGPNEIGLRRHRSGEQDALRCDDTGLADSRSGIPGL